MNAASIVRRGLALALAMGLSACTTIPRDAPTYARAARAELFKANLYFYRKGTRPSLLTPTVLVDGQPVLDLLEGAYTMLTVSAGVHIVKLEWPWTATVFLTRRPAAWPTLEFPVTVGDRDEAYLRLTVGFDVDYMGNMYRIGLKVDPILQTLAEAEMLECCRYMAPVKDRIRSRADDGPKRQRE